MNIKIIKNLVMQLSDKINSNTIINSSTPYLYSTYTLHILNMYSNILYIYTSHILHSLYSTYTPHIHLLILHIIMKPCAKKCNYLAFHRVFETFALPKCSAFLLWCWHRFFVILDNHTESHKKISIKNIFFIMSKIDFEKKNLENFSSFENF